MNVAPGPDFRAEQYIDLRVKTKAQLGTFDEFAWGSGYGSAGLGIATKGAKKIEITVTCDTN